jgi:hypothetical protein
MDIKRSGSQPSTKGPAEYFTGSVRIDTPFKGETPARAGGAIVTFEPAARTAWHRHPLGQTLIVTAGCGWAQREGGPIEETIAEMRLSARRNASARKTLLLSMWADTAVCRSKPLIPDGKRDFSRGRHFLIELTSYTTPPSQIRPKYHGGLPTVRHLRRTNPQRCETGRSSGRSTNQIRIRRQSQDCQIPWASYSVGADFIRRRGD